MSQLFCMLVVVLICGSTAHPHGARRYESHGLHRPEDYRSYRAPRQLQRRLGIPFTGDVREESFEEYLRAQGVTFNSLFDQPQQQRTPAARADEFSAGGTLPIDAPDFFAERLTPPPKPTNRRKDQSRFGASAFAEAPPSPQQSFNSVPTFPRQTAFSEPAPYTIADQRGGDGVFYRPQASINAAPYSDAAPRDTADRSTPPYPEARFVYPAAEITAALQAAPPAPAAVARPLRPQQRRKTVVPLVPAPAPPPQNVVQRPLSPPTIANTFVRAPLRRESVVEPAVSARRPVALAVRRQDTSVRRQDAPLSADPQRLDDFTASATALGTAQAAERQDVGYALQIPKKQEKQRLEFQVHGQQGPHSYKFGYDTGSGYNRQFRFEERDGYGNLRGRYGFYDKSGKLQIVNYSATPEGGFHAEGDFGKFPNKEHR